MMRHRLITLICGAALASPVAAHAPHRVMSTVCGSIGVRVGPMTAAFADSLGMTESYGAIFKRPNPGSPAASAGIEGGDVVTTINGAPLSNWRDFAPTISAMAPGATVYLNTRRSGQLIVVPVIVGSSKCSVSSAKTKRLRASRRTAVGSERLDYAWRPLTKLPNVNASATSQ
jgi:predicted metalloprotease with PDZ domain